MADKSSGQASRRPLEVFCAATAAIYGGFLLIDLHFFDRYFFQLCPFLLVFLLPAKPPGPARLLFSGAVLAAMAVFSVSATHDYLSWNRARWQAIHHLTEEKNVAPRQMDGGFEFNGWHKPGLRGEHEGKSWWWVDEQEYVVSFGGLPGFQKQLGFPYERWLPPGTDTIYILKQE